MEREELIVLLRQYFELRDGVGNQWELQQQLERKLRLETLTDNDRALIAKANELHYCDWPKGADYIKQCDTSSAKIIINSRMAHLCHVEEAHSDNL